MPSCEEANGREPCTNVPVLTAAYAIVNGPKSQGRLAPAVTGVARG
jgi:hypothetical protein